MYHALISFVVDGLQQLGVSSVYLSELLQAWYLQSPSLVICQVEMELVELVHGHNVEIPLGE